MSISVNLLDIYSGFLSAEAFNANNTLIEEALGKALNREGGDDNAMEADLDMGLNNIFNLKEAILNHQAVPLKQVLDLLSSSSTEITSLVDMEDRITATEGQTSIELEVIKYTPFTNSLMVFKNGEYQRASLEYNETGNTSIEFVIPLTAGDVVDIFGSRYDAQQYVELALTAAKNAEQSKANAEQFAQDAQASADLAVQAAGYKLDVNNQTGVTYTMTTADAGDFIRMDNPADNTVVVPANANAPFEIGTIVLIRQIGEGTTTIQPALGVTVNAPYNGYEISQADFGIALVKVAQDEWDMIKTFGGVDTSELAAFTQEFDDRLDELFKEILSASPTFVVNFDSLRNFVTTTADTLNQEFDTLESNTNSAVSNIQNGFAAISDDFNVIEQQFTDINSEFSTIQSDFSSIQSSFAGISSDFTTIQSEWSDVDQRMDDIQDSLDALNLGSGFDNQKATSGYTNLPNGIILQWGRSTAQRLANTVISFPKSFPNTCFNVSLTDATVGSYSGAYETGVFLASKTRDSFTVKQQKIGDTGGGAVNSSFEWLAIGY
tara:strand:+ start:4095 stop:5744 length:1650 start_codon:yes stop_codon:yes gene_type:complete